MVQLPPEVYSVIASYVNARDILRVARTAAAARTHMPSHTARDPALRPQRQQSAVTRVTKAALSREVCGLAEVRAIGL